ncbi:MAG: MFS transporter [Candidatus Woesearchaeota archaeon]
MSHLTHSHLHEFFKNKELNQLYLAVAIMTFGEALISIFVPIYLYKLNYPIYSIVFYFFLICFSFVMLSYPGAKIVSRLGTKHAILISTPSVALYYLGLRALETQSWLFFILPILLASRLVLYNYGYHLNFITHSDRKKRGKEVSFIGALSILVSAIAPLIGGFIAYYSFSTLYLTGAVVIVLGTIPLFLGKDVHEAIKFTPKDLIQGIFSKKHRGMFVSFAGYAIESVIGRIIWPIFLITILLTLKKTGFVVMLSMLVSLLVFYIIGKVTDKYDKVKLLKLGTLLYFFAWVGRLFANTTYKILFIDSYKNITEKVLHIPWSAHSYDLAMRRGYFSFIVGREIIFNLTRIVVMPFLALIFFIGFYPFLISFIIAALFSIGYVFIDKSQSFFLS